MIPTSNKSVVFTVVISSLFWLTSCVTETIESPSAKFSDAEVISVGDPGARVASGSSYAWMPEAMRF